MKSLKQLEQKDLKKIRVFYHKQQKNTCPILKQEFPVDDMVVDHKHRKKSTKIGKDDCGLVRGVIQRQANVIEGKISNAYVRYGLGKFNVSIPEFLRNLADYLENPPLLEKRLIHPNEKSKLKKLKKTSFNKLKKMYDGNIKFPQYPRSGKLTVALEKLFEEYEIKPEFYK
jgi:hypothetical protein